MPYRDWLYVGIKLLAVYFGVVGAATAAVVGFGLLAQSFYRAGKDLDIPVPIGTQVYTTFDLIEPVIYVAAAWFLGRNTRLVFELLRIPTTEVSDEQPTPDPAGHDHD